MASPSSNGRINNDFLQKREIKEVKLLAFYYIEIPSYYVKLAVVIKC